MLDFRVLSTRVKRTDGYFWSLNRIESSVRDCYVLGLIDSELRDSFLSAFYGYIEDYFGSEHVDKYISWLNS